MKTHSHKNVQKLNYEILQKLKCIPINNNIKSNSNLKNDLVYRFQKTFGG